MVGDGEVQVIQKPPGLEQFGAQIDIGESKNLALGGDAGLLVGSGAFQHFAIAVRVLTVKNQFANSVQQPGDEEMFALTEVQPLGQTARGEAGHDAVLPEPIHVDLIRRQAFE